ncbi:NADH:flavin oxidoreductase/NADH oxidase [uncultured Pseudokineococcus sp.]|uniref:NADH:flavin oxidoreductase/NADH oxidase n=1 Tax=uncultured Pseudokineococcus sp. TaxID=1642928 RepID=UPI00261B61DF|nr:NADH:flavin oxidoreductase/NADH oxidase [uncultured Pseudokineococcus sp.]
MTTLFDPLQLRDVEIPNRIWVSPMCQYSCDPVGAPGLVHDWHLVHLGSFALGGAGLVLTEAAAVSPEGRISPEDAGIWTDEQARAWARVVAFLHAQGSRAGVQLAHAGRKASTYRPFEAAGTGSVPAAEGGWETVGPSAEAFGRYAEPRALDAEGLRRVVEDFAAAARRADEAGFDVVEVHAAHGYLLHQFLSPLSNRREDSHGGDLAGRARLLLEVVDAVRAVWPQGKPVVVRVSATDWTDGGLQLDEVVTVSGWLREHGVDLVDVSTGGNSPAASIPVAPGYQVPHAEAVRRGAGVATGAVGMITDPAQAAQVVAQGQADVVLLARELLRDPRWPQRAARELGGQVARPPQYARA